MTSWGCLGNGGATTFSFFSFYKKVFSNMCHKFGALWWSIATILPKLDCSMLFPFSFRPSDTENKNSVKSIFLWVPPKSLYNNNMWFWNICTIRTIRCIVIICMEFDAYHTLHTFGMRDPHTTSLYSFIFSFDKFHHRSVIITQKNLFGILPVGYNRID